MKYLFNRNDTLTFRSMSRTGTTCLDPAADESSPFDRASASTAREAISTWEGECVRVIERAIHWSVTEAFASRPDSPGAS